MSTLTNFISENNVKGFPDIQYGSLFPAEYEKEISGYFDELYSNLEFQGAVHKTMQNLGLDKSKYSKGFGTVPDVIGRVKVQVAVGIPSWAHIEKKSDTISPEMLHDPKIIEACLNDICESEYGLQTFLRIYSKRSNIAQDDHQDSRFIEILQIAERARGWEKDAGMNIHGDEHNNEKFLREDYRSEFYDDGGEVAINICRLSRGQKPEERHRLLQNAMKYAQDNQNSIRGPILRKLVFLEFLR